MDESPYIDSDDLDSEPALYVPALRGRYHLCTADNRAALVDPDSILECRRCGAAVRGMRRSSHLWGVHGLCVPVEDLGPWYLPVSVRP